MTLEEAKNLAEQGDVGAMGSLGNYFWEQENIEEAAKWFDLAAQHNIVYAAHMAVKAHNIIAISALAIVNKVEYGWAFARDDTKAAFDASVTEMTLLRDQAPGYDNVNPDEAYSDFVNNAYRYALCSYEMGDKEEAIRILDGNEKPEARVLYGQALIESSIGDENVGAAFDGLRCLESADLGEAEEELYARAVFTLSMMYREGIPERSVPANLEKSVMLLAKASERLKDPKFKGIIDTELSRYKKKMFGGYRYEE